MFVAYIPILRSPWRYVTGNRAQGLRAAAMGFGFSTENGKGVAKDGGRRVFILLKMVV